MRGQRHREEDNDNALDFGGTGGGDPLPLAVIYTAAIRYTRPEWCPACSLHSLADESLLSL